jgi:hypothetical protein
MIRLFVIVIACFLLSAGVAFAAEVPTSTTNVTKDDLIAHPVGRAVKDLNERMRKVGEKADGVDRGIDPDSYNILKSGFEDLKKKRDEAGEDIRGLRGFEVVLYGDKAIGNPAGVKQAMIDYYIRNPSQRHMQPFHAHYDKNGAGPFISTSPPDPEDIITTRQADTARLLSRGIRKVTTLTPVAGSWVLNLKVAVRNREAACDESTYVPDCSAGLYFAGMGRALIRLGRFNRRHGAPDHGYHER